METGINFIVLLVCNIGISLFYGWRYRRKLESMSVGTLRIVDDGQEPQPYLFVELNAPPNTLVSQEYVMMKVRAERYSQE